MDQLALFKSAKIKEPELVKRRADLIQFFRPKYSEVSKVSGVPWQIIGCIHSLETGCLMSRHLHNGDPLKARTVHVPKGRPVKAPKDGRVYSWEESAIDALLGRSIPKDRSLTAWLSFCEAYNGLGYRKRGLVSPYLWSFTDAYEKGYYGADGHFSPDLVSKNIGVVALLKTLGVTDETFS